MKGMIESEDEATIRKYRIVRSEVGREVRREIPLLRLKYYDFISDAVADLGKPEEIGAIFAGFQKYLYKGKAVA